MASSRRSLAPLVPLCALVLAATGAGCDKSQWDFRKPADKPPSTLAPARFQATVYEVRVPAATIGDLDAKALADKGPTAAGFAKALEAVGKTKALYQLDQSVNPAKDRAMISTRVPTVTGTRIAEGGKVLNTVQYQSVGALFKFSADPSKATSQRLELQLDVEISALVDTAVEVGGGTKASAVRSYSLTYTGPIDLGRPFVFFSVDGSAKDPDGNAIAYVCRAVLGEAAAP